MFKAELKSDTLKGLVNIISTLIDEVKFTIGPEGMTLKAGTIIATGTPAGVGMGMDPPQFLKPGDTVRCEIDGIGSLTNTVR